MVADYSSTFFPNEVLVYNITSREIANSYIILYVNRDVKGKKSQILDVRSRKGLSFDHGNFPTVGLCSGYRVINQFPDDFISGHL